MLLKKSRQHFRFLAGLAMIAAGTGAAAAQTVLHRPLEVEPESLDPQKTMSAPAQAVLRDLFDGLVTLDATGKPVPGDAESWDVAPDGRTWTFHLRPGLKWSNGEALTSADYVYAFRRLVDPATTASDPSSLKQLVNYHAIVSGAEKDLTKLGVEAPDPATLRLHLTEPRLALKFVLTDPQTYPLPKAAIERWGKDWTQPGHLVSNGPYALKSWIPQTVIGMERNPNFHDAGSVKLAEVEWLAGTDYEVALRRFRAGELDWADCTRNDIQICRGELADRLHTAPINSYTFIAINLTKGPLAADMRIREALNLATDRELITEKIVPLGEKPAYSITPEVISDYAGPVMAFKDRPMPERIAKAQGLMRAAGFGPDHPLRLTISYPTQEQARQILVAIAHMWQAIYVEASLDNMEFQVLEGRLNTRDYELVAMGGMGPYDDFESGLDNYRSDAGPFNWAGYSNTRYDEVFHRGSTSLDTDERRSLMAQAEAVLLADYPIVPIYFGALNRVTNPRLRHMDYGLRYPESRYLAFAD